jgi:hypothetical protein
MNTNAEMEINKLLINQELKEDPNIKENEDSKEETMNYNKQYYKLNKERLQEKYKSRVKCPLCDKDVAKSSLTLHYKTQLCQKRQEIKLKQMLMNNIINTELDKYYAN